MIAVDRLGFHLRVKTNDGLRGVRIAFLREVSNPAETRKVLVEMVQQASDAPVVQIEFVPPKDGRGQVNAMLRPQKSALFAPSRD